MGKRIKLYKCNAMIIDEEGLYPSMSYSKVITEYIFAGSKTEATNIFESRYRNNIYQTVSEMNISPGLVIYKNLYNSTIEDNELTLSVERSDNK